MFKTSEYPMTPILFDIQNILQLVGGVNRNIRYLQIFFFILDIYLCFPLLYCHQMKAAGHTLSLEFSLEHRMLFKFLEEREGFYDFIHIYIVGAGNALPLLNFLEILKDIWYYFFIYRCQNLDVRKVY